MIAEDKKTSHFEIRAGCNRSRLTGVLGVMFALVAGCVGASPISEQLKESRFEQPNIIFIFADDLGYGDLGTFGSPTVLSPNLDRMSAQGLKLTSFYAGAPTCTPSRATLMTGRYAVRSGMEEVLFPNEPRGLMPSEQTLAETLKSAGYNTALVGKWHLGDMSPYMPTQNGFDSYFGLLNSNDMIPPWVTEEMPFVEHQIDDLQFYRNETPLEEEVEQSMLTKRYTEEALNWIAAQDTKQPYFLYLAYAMPHLPIDASPKFKGTSRAGLYGDVVAEMDAGVGRILAAVSALESQRETLVVFTSDNGPWGHLPDRMLQGGVERWHSGSAGPLRGTKATTYEGGLRVPAIFWWPGRIAPGVTAEPASTLDMLPTLTRLGGGAVSDHVRLDGRDISEILLGGVDELPAEPFFYFRERELEAVRVGEWKLRISHQRDDKSLLDEHAEPTVELFNLDIDPGEQFNRAAELPDIVQRLSDVLLNFESELEDQQ